MKIVVILLLVILPALMLIRLVDVPKEEDTTEHALKKSRIAAKKLKEAVFTQSIEIKDVLIHWVKVTLKLFRRKK
ncbi:hypothetical protein GUI37_01600 [Helcococcus kunzii]|uniref:hypothetical protein n=1 Tax=Helcococcus kunzii TaxID=40091 RepID=UPI001BAEFF2E|nr:hypothetical protein [Helcococcus kunzii]QUY64281.1 hypothetical protein GUI37_01600 [Helcococcus kunzii]